MLGQVYCWCGNVLFREKADVLGGDCDGKGVSDLLAGYEGDTARSSISVVAATRG
jgi:hypothetical protein